MTDIIKDFEQKVSGKLMKYLRDNKDFEKSNIDKFIDSQGVKKNKQLGHKWGVTVDKYGNTNPSFFHRPFEGTTASGKKLSYTYEVIEDGKTIKNEMEEFLSGDTELNTLRVKIDYLETMIYFLESVLGQIKARDWQIKTAVEWKKFLAGM